MRLLLGCGDERRDGWERVDRSPRAAPDVVHDLDVVPWPFEDDSVEEVEANDVLEHLADVVRFMDECWRVLVPGGRLRIKAVSWRSENLWRDPTHRRGFHVDTFGYFDPSQSWGQKYGKFYSDRQWRLLLALDDGDAVRAEMVPIKECVR